MEEKISFERFLFGDGNEIRIDDIEFCVDRIVVLPKIRPHQLEKAVRLSVEYCQIADFRRKILEKSYKCSVLIYQLYKRGIFEFGEIEPFLNNDTFLLCYYFRKEINDFESFIESKYTNDDIDELFLENENDIDQLFKYGFPPSSIEYCLKYDVIDDLASFDNLKQEAKWSPFEWGNKPEYLDLLSFSGFYGSIKCFKHLLMKGFEINDNVLSMVVCGGSFDLYHICQGQQSMTPNIVDQATQFFHLPLLVFLLENGSDINSKNKYGWTPLHSAAWYGHLSVVEYIVNQKADINEKSTCNLTPLHFAADNGHLIVVEYLVNQKADINSKNNHSWTPLHYAADKGHLSVVEYLVNQKADINSKNTIVEFLYLIGLLFIMLLLMVI